MVNDIYIRKHDKSIAFLFIKGYIHSMLNKQEQTELTEALANAQPPSYHAITIPLREYLELLGVQTREEQAREAAEKILNKIRKVSRSLGLFLSGVNKKIPLETYFQSFNEAQDDIIIYIEDNKVRLKITNEQQQQDSPSTGEHSEEVSATV